MIYCLQGPRPWSSEAAYIDVDTDFFHEELVVDRLYAGWTPETVPIWQGFPLLNVEAELYGLDVQDFVWGGFGDVIVSEHLLRILQSEGITGLDTRKVNIWAVNVKGHDLMEEQPDFIPPKLHRLVAKGIIQRVSFRNFRGDDNWPVVLDLSTWDGLDLTVVWGEWLLTFVSQRFIDCLRRYNVRNYRAVPGREFMVNDRPCIAFPRSG